jgi:hypothetical protein
MSRATERNPSSTTPRVSSESRAFPGTTLMIPGSNSISPTVPTVPFPASFASRSTSRTICAAVGATSRRKSIGVAPAWSARPSTQMSAWT